MLKDILNRKLESLEIAGLALVCALHEDTGNWIIAAVKDTHHRTKVSLPSWQLSSASR